MVGIVQRVSALGGNALVSGEGGAAFIVMPMPDGRLQISASSDFGTIHSRLDARPPLPSNTAVGPVKPSCANCAANTALRDALAPAQPFQFDRLPRRACASDIFGASAIATAFAIWSRESCSSLPAPNTQPSTPYTG